MGDDDEQRFHGPGRPDALIWREAADQAGGKPASQGDGSNITHTVTGWLPTLRSRESLDQALRNNGQLLGERVRAGAVSHDEREFLDDLVNGRIKPGKGLHNQRVKTGRRRCVAEFVSKMKRENPKMQLQSIRYVAMERFGIERTEFFNSLEENDSVVVITNDQVVVRAEELAKASGKNWPDHIAEARIQLDGEVESNAEAQTTSAESNEPT